MQRIAESELIINSRGAIYHLDVRPEELAGTIIVVGDPERVKKVSIHFDKIEHRLQHREFITHTGYIGNKHVSVISTGIGPDNIDIVFNELDALANIDFETRTIKEKLAKLNIIRFGTSGSLQADIPVDSFVASTHGLGLDNLLNFYKYEKTAADQEMANAFTEQTGLDIQITRPYAFSGSNLLLQKFGDHFHKGITVTCPGFFGPQGRVLRLGLNSPELVDRLTHFNFNNHRITNFEMETSAIYGLGKLMGHECLSVNAIIANRVVKEFSKDSDAAVEKMIKKALEALTAS
ncbi:MAG: nucleoside phosphorylase [Chitinophagaceae bacterium]|nr:nucleoside phosphorylase [Chitinophagaceae bacterium]MBK9531382.1 nucleoside phosphorylase [Chitinophagaceae bacterium]HQW92476.1 nucleoside phosphorylase [Ferruginibacter sp.]